MQQLQSVLNSATHLIFNLKRFDHITPALFDLHWLPYPQRITYKLCMFLLNACMVQSLHILQTVVLELLWCLVDRFWDLRFIVTLSSLVIEPTGDWDLLLWPGLAVRIFCRLIWDLPLLAWILLQNTWKHMCLGMRILDRTRTFEFVLHSVKCETVAVSPTQIIIIITPGNWYKG